MSFDTREPDPPEIPAPSLGPVPRLGMGIPAKYAQPEASDLPAKDELDSYRDTGLINQEYSPEVLRGGRDVVTRIGHIRDAADQDAAADERTDRPHEPDDFLTGHVVNLIESGLETVLWKTAEALSVQVTPLGPAIVRGVYLSRQLHTFLMRLQDGRGFVVKMTIPGLGGVLPEGFELVAHVKLASEKHGMVSRPGVWSEIQIFEPWVDNLDVKRTDDGAASGRVPPAESVAPAEVDPWRVWLSLLGAPLIHKLSWALHNAARLSLDTIEQALLADRYSERDDVPGFPRP